MHERNVVTVLVTDTQKNTVNVFRNNASKANTSKASIRVNMLKSLYFEVLVSYFLVRGVTKEYVTLFKDCE